MPHGSGWPTEADYAWAEGRDAFCVSFVEAMSPEAVLEKMAGGCGTGIVTVAEARERASDQTELDYGSAIEAGMVGGWVVTVEANGYQGTLPEVVRAISKGSRAIVVFCNIHAHTRFLYAVDGVVVRSFDPLLYDDPTPWDGPPLPEESGLDFGSGHPMASAFACAERLTRVRLTSDLLDEHGDCFAIGHHPLHSLTRAAFWGSDTADAEPQACVEDPRRQSTPNRLVWGDDVYDARDLFVVGWIGWIQLFLCWTAAAAIVAAGEGLGPEYVDGLSGPESLLVILSLLVEK